LVGKQVIDWPADDGLGGW